MAARSTRGRAPLLDESHAIGATFMDWFEERDGVAQSRSPVAIEKLHNTAVL